MPRLAIAALVLLAVACGSAKAGDACTSAGPNACDTSTSALFCDTGRTLRSVQCRGGCAVSGNTVICTYGTPVADDACATAAEGTASCGAPDSGVAFKCSSNTWASIACPVCTVDSSNAVTCASP